MLLASNPEPARRNRLPRRLAVLLWVAVAPLGAAGAAGRADVLYQLPRESGEVGFLDLQTLRASPHYALLKQRLLPARFAQFERFVVSLGVNTDTDLDWLAWALLPPNPQNPSELFVGLAQGQFAPEKAEKFFAQQKLPTEDYNGQTLYPFGSGQGLYFTFLDPSTAAFGTRRSLEALLDTRLGLRENLLSNDALLAQVQEVNGLAPVWVALDEYYTRLAVHQLTPEVARFREFGVVSERFRASLIQMNVEREVSLSFQAWCNQPADAQTFSMLLQAGLAAQSWQLQSSVPALSTVLNRAEVRSSGDRLEVRLWMEEETFQAFLKQRQPL